MQVSNHNSVIATQSLSSGIEDQYRAQGRIRRWNLCGSQLTSGPLSFHDWSSTQVLNPCQQRGLLQELAHFGDAAELLSHRRLLARYVQWKVSGNANIMVH